jgi:hypothetical protein
MSTIMFPPVALPQSVCGLADVDGSRSGETDASRRPRARRSNPSPGIQRCRRLVFAITFGSIDLFVTR